MDRIRIHTATRIGGQVLLSLAALFVFSLGLGIGLSQNQNLGMVLLGVSVVMIAFVAWWVIRSASSKRGT